MYSRMSCIQERLQLQMSYLAVADGLHPMNEHLGEALEVEKLIVQPEHLHFHPPIAFAILSSATMRGEYLYIPHLARQHLVKILAGITQQRKGSIEEQSRNIVLDTPHRLGIGEAMQIWVWRRSPLLFSSRNISVFQITSKWHNISINIKEQTNRYGTPYPSILSSAKWSRCFACSRTMGRGQLSHLPHPCSPW